MDREPGAGGDHRGGSLVNRVDDLRVVDPTEIRGGDPEVGMTELALDHEQRHALTRHLDSVRMPQLVRREPPAHSGSLCGAVQLPADPRSGARPAACRPAQNAEQDANRRRARRSSQGSSCVHAHRSMPTSRRLPPWRCRTKSAPRSGSRSVSVSASASLILNPARQSTTITPRSLSPSGSSPAALMTAMISSTVGALPHRSGTAAQEASSSLPSALVLDRCGSASNPMSLVLRWVREQPSWPTT